MPRLLIFSSSAWVAVMFVSIAPAQELPFHAGAVVRFASVEEGAGLLGREDAFTEALSRFDVQSRLKTGDDVNATDLRQFAARQVEAWSKEEIESLTARLESLRHRLKEYPPLFPETILLIKTTGDEEGDAAYCRQNAIVLPRRMLRRPADGLERLLAHELFHVLSRHDAERQQRLYAVVGFRRCGDVELPAGLRDRKITNPDAPRLDYYLELATDEGPVPATPVLFSEMDYDPTSRKSFFQYLQFRLLQLAEENGQWRAARDDAGGPVLLDPQAEPSYHEQIGRNTEYILHPEEVLAENFVHLLFRTENLPTAQIIQKMDAALKSRSPQGERGASAP
jgi:hypothetical protein